MHKHSEFDKLAQRLEEKVYKSAKGMIRLSLIQEDLEDFLPGFTRPGLLIDDIGGGSGHFAAACARRGHRIRLIENSAAMIEGAHRRKESLPPQISKRIEIIRADYMKDPIPSPPGDRQLCCLHGSAEWMKDSREALLRTCNEMSPGSYLSLLIFNRDRQNLKQGINGQLHRANPPEKPRRLTPPGGLSSAEVREILSPEGEILLQSGIRVFHDFFRQFDPGTLTESQWLEQEREWYRKEPFNALGEHSHFIWRKHSDGP